MTMPTTTTSSSLDCTCNSAAAHDTPSHSHAMDSIGTWGSLTTNTNTTTTTTTTKTTRSAAEQHTDDRYAAPSSRAAVVRAHAHANRPSAEPPRPVHASADSGSGEGGCDVSRSDSRSSVSGSQTIATFSQRSSATGLSSSIPYLYHLPRGPVEAMQETIQLLEALQRVSQYNSELETRMTYSQTVHDVSASRQAQKMLRLVQHNEQLQRTVRDLQQRVDLDQQQVAALEARLRHVRRVLPHERRRSGCPVHGAHAPSSDTHTKKDDHEPTNHNTEYNDNGNTTTHDSNDNSNNSNKNNPGNNNYYYELQSFCCSCESRNEKDGTTPCMSRNAAAAPYTSLIAMEARHRHDLRTLYESTQALLQSAHTECTRVASAQLIRQQRACEEEREARARAQSQLAQRTQECDARGVEAREAATAAAAAARECAELTRQLHASEAREAAAAQSAEAIKAEVIAWQRQRDDVASACAEARAQMSELTEQLHTARAQLADSEAAQRAASRERRELQAALAQAEVQQRVCETEMRAQETAYDAQGRAHAEALTAQYARYARLVERLRRAKLQLAAVSALPESRGRLDWPPARGACGERSGATRRWSLSR